MNWFERKFLQAAALSSSLTAILVSDWRAGSLPMHNVLPRLSATPGALRRPAPALGEHNLEILRGLDMSEAEVARLTEAGVLGS
ncbi:MAG TPA: hypothetical protein VHK45_01860 [Geminicoccaceae bacterium]|nr:hypothetical protein [Geminicoccaceae bacterium]